MIAKRRMRTRNGSRFIDWQTGIDIVNGPFGVGTEPASIHPV